MLTVVRKNKTYSKRKLYIYDDNKNRINIVEPWMGWFSLYMCKTLEEHTQIRKVIMEHLYWLLGKDCDYQTWIDYVNDWDRGKRIYGVALNKLPESNFFEGEKEIALNSFYNN